MRHSFEELRITNKNHYKATLKQHWKFLFIKSDVLQFKEREDKGIRANPPYRPYPHPNPSQVIFSNKSWVIQISLGRTVHAGQDLNLSEGLVDMIPRAAIRDMWWYIIKPNGKKQTIVFCNSSSCLLLKDVKV